MNRRTFVALSTSAVGLTPWYSHALFFNDPSKPAWLKEWVKINDQRLESYQKYRITDAASQAYGGCMDGNDILNPHSTADFIKRASLALSNKESAYYHSADLMSQVRLALKFLLKIQHEDGTIDLLETNFHSTPDTGFIVKRLAMAYKQLAASNAPGLEKILPDFKSFLVRGGEALKVGGIHTPNHRWVVSAALTKLNELWPNPAYVARIEEWLAEHIDMDADGQYNERSTYIYSPLTNRLLITIAKGLKKPELLEFVRRNLNMTMYYVHPNGEIVTEASGRQDKALIGTMESYYYAYRYMALLDNNGQMAAMCRLIENTAAMRQAEFLDYMLDDSFLWKELPASKPLPTNYAKEFLGSGVVRIRRENWDSTLFTNNAAWLTFHKGNAVLQGMRVAASFFGKGQFQSEKIEKEGNSWVLKSKLEGPYFQPIAKEEIAADGDWEKMPKSKRRQSEIQYLESIVRITENNNGLEVDIQMQGTDGVPVSLELIFRTGGVLSGVINHPTKEKAYLLAAANGTYQLKGDTITFGPGKALHKNIQLRGALAAVDAPTVYLTGFTPFKHTIRIS